MLPLVDGQIRVPLVFGLSEVRQHIFIAPARIALGLPMVKVTFVAANVQHCVEHGRTAQDLSPGPTATLIYHGLAGTLLGLGPGKQVQEVVSDLINYLIDELFMAGIQILWAHGV